jgi:hypothetical protein
VAVLGVERMRECISFVCWREYECASSKASLFAMYRVSEMAGLEM